MSSVMVPVINVIAAPCGVWLVAQLGTEEFHPVAGGAEIFTGFGERDVEVFKLIAGFVILIAGVGVLGADVDHFSSLWSGSSAMLLAHRRAPRTGAKGFNTSSLRIFKRFPRSYVSWSIKAAMIGADQASIEFPGNLLDTNVVLAHKDVTKADGVVCVPFNPGLRHIILHDNSIGHRVALVKGFLRNISNFFSRDRNSGNLLGVNSYKQNCARYMHKSICCNCYKQKAARDLHRIGSAEQAGFALFSPKTVSETTLARFFPCEKPVMFEFYGIIKYSGIRCVV